MATDAPERIVLPDSPTREDIVEALGHATFSAKRAPCIVEKLTTDPLNEWGKRHAFIDALLWDWQAASE